MLLSIIIINYNTFQLTCDCIRSIKQTAHVEHEIILVDNNSRECPAERFLEVFPDVKLIALKENVGFGRANNRGVEEARGKYVLLLNSDTLVHERTLDETVGYMENNPEIDILGCRVFLNDNVEQNTVVKYEGEADLWRAILFLIKRNTLFVETRLFFKNLRSRRKKTPASGETQFPEQRISKKNSPVEPNMHNGSRIGALVGVFLLLKRSVFIESRGFDPDFFMYYEEIEWFVKRLRKYNIVYYPHASITHFHCGSNVHGKMNLQFHVSNYLFWYKMGYVQFLLFFVYILFEIPSRLLVGILYGRSKPRKDIPAMLKSMPYFFKVLRYPNKFGARKKMLKIKYLEKNNL